MKKVLLFFILAMTMIWAGCEPIDGPSSDKVATGEASDITYYSAKLRGVVNVDISTYESIEYGIMWAQTKEELNVNDGRLKSAEILVGKDFEITLAFLSAEKEYYYCAYILLNEIQYEFGKIQKFKTGNLPTLEAVDLGLSVKWANMNIGATRPDDSGDFFAWGDIKDIEDNSLYDYKWYDDDARKYTKYNSVDNKTILDPEDDAAHVIWGDDWRMPTAAEMSELIRECDWEIDEIRDGYIVTSKKNGNSIYIPDGGYLTEAHISKYYGQTFLWSSTLDSESHHLARCLHGASYALGIPFEGREKGLPIRPVFP